MYMKYSTLPRMASSKMKMMMIAMMKPLPPGGTNKKVQAAGYTYRRNVQPKILTEQRDQNPAQTDVLAHTLLLQVQNIKECYVLAK